MVEVLEERPPYVQFETRAVEDRNASIEAGHYVAKDVDFALITPQGSKDVVERIVSEWFEKLVQDVKEDRFPADWLRAYRAYYKEWKEGREIPLDGTPIRNWSLLSPAQVKMLLDINVRTVEDLAGANEETLGRIGMGGHDLKAKAKAWLDSAQDKGKLAQRIAALEAENNDLKNTNAELASTNKELDARLSTLEAKFSAAPGKKL